jgi:hypothetical protein
MWFSYAMEDSWVPLELDRVKEIQKQNKEGIIPPDLGEIVEIESKPAKALDYENVVGEDSLTRLDERNRNKKKNNKNRNKNQGNKAPQGAVVPQQVKEQKPAEANNTNGQNNKNRNNRRFKPNRNNRNDQNKGGNESGA